jgi:hypothetical protein
MRRNNWRSPLALAMTTVLTAALACAVTGTPAAAAQTIGYPTFSGPSRSLRSVTPRAA